MRVLRKKIGGGGGGGVGVVVHFANSDVSQIYMLFLIPINIREN